MDSNTDTAKDMGTRTLKMPLPQRDDLNEHDHMAGNMLPPPPLDNQTYRQRRPSHSAQHAYSHSDFPSMSTSTAYSTMSAPFSSPTNSMLHTSPQLPFLSGLAGGNPLDRVLAAPGSPQRHYTELFSNLNTRDTNGDDQFMQMASNRLSKKRTFNQYAAQQPLTPPQSRPGSPNSARPLIHPQLTAAQRKALDDNEHHRQLLQMEQQQQQQQQHCQEPGLVLVNGVHISTQMHAQLLAQGVDPSALSPTALQSINGGMRSMMADYNSNYIDGKLIVGSNSGNSNSNSNKKAKKSAPTSVKMFAPPATIRRQLHIECEQKRRRQIKGGLDEIRAELPDCDGKKMSKAETLMRALDYLRQVKSERAFYLARCEEMQVQLQQLAGGQLSE